MCPKKIRPLRRVLRPALFASACSLLLFFAADSLRAINNFVPTTPMTAGRFYHTATLLPNGEVLLAGGKNNTTALRTAEIYNPTTGAVTRTGDLTVPRLEHTATLLPDGTVLIAGGITNTRLSSAEIYDPVTRTFTTTGSMSAGRAQSSATLLANGMVLIAGGNDAASADLYDPASRTFGPAQNAMIASRSYHSATLLPNGRVLIVGGYNATFGYLSTAEIFDPVSMRFSPAASMSRSRYSHSATLLGNGSVLMAGGYDGFEVLAAAELYNPATDKFTSTGSMIAARYRHAGALLGSGNVLVAGGTDDTSLASAEQYNPDTGTFAQTGSLSTARSVAAVTRLNDGNVLISGGFNNGGLSSNELYLAHPASTNTSVIAATASYGGTTTLSATLTAGSGGVSGRQVDFTVNGQFAGSTVTNASGIATLAGVTFTPPFSPGNYPIVATFAGDAGLAGSSGNASLTVKQAIPTLIVSGSGAFIYTSQPHPATAVATGALGEMLGPVTVTYTNLADSTTSTTPPSLVGNYRVNASFAGNANYFAASNNSQTTTITPAVASASSDVAVNVGWTRLFKLNGADGSTLWGPINRPNCGGLAVDQDDFSVYTSDAANCTGGGAGSVFKYSSAGSLTWNRPYAGCGPARNYYVGLGGIAVDTTSSNPGVVLTKTGFFGDVGKVSRNDGATLFCNATNDLGRPTIDPASGQIFAITNLGGVGYNTIYSVSATGSSTSTAFSCQGLTELNPADGMLYRGGGMPGNGCGQSLSQMNKADLATPNWTIDLSGAINSFDAIAIQPWNGGYVYAASVGSGKIAVIDPQTRTVVTTFTTAVAPDFIAVSPVGGHVYVASFSNQFVYAYSPTGTLLWTSADLGGPIRALAAPRNLIGGQVVASPTTTSVATSANPAFSGQTITLTATVTATDGTATGSVTFKDGTTTIGTATLSGGTAIFSTSSLAVGSHSITAVYAGALGFISSTSPAFAQVVNPPPLPTAAFTATPNPAACGQTLLFDASGSQAGTGFQLTSYQWNFGDNTTGTGQTIAHAYSTFGTYTATLTVTDNYAPAQSSTTSITVTVDRGNRAPIANHGGPYLVDVGAAASLNGAGSSDPDAACGDSIVSYAWSINNGAISASGPSPTLPAAQLAALGTGIFPLSLTVTDEFGTANTTATTLSIFNNVPTASFTANPNPAFCSQAITFNGTLSTAGRPDRSIVAYEWDFGDGTTGIGATTTHSYSSFGSYTARLKVTDTNVPAKTAISTILVNVNQGNNAPVANHGGPYLVDVGSPASLNGAGSSDPNAACGDSIVSYSWSINNGMITASGDSPTLSAAQLAALGTGSFTMSLTVTDEFGAASSTSTRLSIYNNVPTASFTANPNPAFCAQGITFNGTLSTAGRPDRSIVAYEWDFGDGTTAVGSTTTHSYGRFGSYTAKLTVTDNNVPPKTASITSVVNVSQGNFAPVANAGGPYTVNYGGAVQLNAASSSDPNAGCGDQIVSYAWTLDGSIQLSGQTPTLDTALNALSTGNHSLSLVVTDTFGLSSTATTSVTVQRVLASIAVAPTPVTLYSGQQQSFTATGTFSDGSVEVLQSGGGGGGGGQSFGRTRPAWQVQFPQGFNFAACATAQYPLTSDGHSWASQNLFDDNGAVHETWSVGTPVVNVDGQITPTNVTLTLACTNGAATGTINAQWTGNRYEGTLFFNGATSRVSMTGWSPKSSMPTARFNLTASALGPYVYAIGGTAGACTGPNPCPYFPLSTVEIYDPAADSWSPGPSLNTGREGGRAATLGGKIYVIGGHIPGGQPSGVVEVLDPSVSNAWSTLASDPMPTARANFALVTDGAYLYAIGGDNNSGALTTVERFDPAAPSGQRWTTRASLPVGGSLIGAGVLGGTIVVAGAGNSSRTDIYDIAADSWSPGVAMPAQRSGMASAAGANGGLWLIGGTTNGALNYDTWVYYPASPRRPAGWAGVGSMLTARSFAAAASVGDVVYAAGGADAANIALASHEVLSTPPFEDLSTSGWSSSGGGNSPVTVQWQSSSPAVAGVDSNGRATAVGIGQATIIATAGSVSCEATASCATLNVANATPVVQIFNGPVTIDESRFQNFFSGGNFTDPDQQSWTATVNYGDGTGTQPLGLFNLQNGQTPTGRFNLNHAYADSGSYVVTVTVTDSQGGSGTATLQVNVNNVAPQVFGPFSASTTVGSSQQFGCVSFNDVQADSPWTATVNYGDGTGDQAVTPNAGASCGGGGSTVGAFNLSHQYANGGSYTVTVKVTDKDQGTGTATFSVSVNAPPAITIANTPLAAIDEGSAFIGTASFTDAAGDGPWTVRVSYGDNTGQFTLPSMSSPGAVNLSHIYKDNGNYTITVQVTDRFFSMGTATASLVVNNLAPTLNNLPALTAIVEGQQANFSASYSDPGLNDNQSGGFKAQINWGDGSAMQTIQNLPFNSSNGLGNFFANHNYPDNPAASQTAFTITVTVTDKDGTASASKTTQVVVNNDPPSIQLNGTPQPVDGQPVTFTGQLSDRGALDAPWTGTVEFGDGTQQPINFTLSTPPQQTPRATFTVTHTYNQPGPVTLRLTATDKDGATSTRTYQLNVEPIIVSVSLSPAVALLNAPGQTLLFNATALFSDGSTQSTNGAVIDEVSWSSSNPAVATIGPGGLATVVGAGVTTIRVTAQDDEGHTFTATSTLTVDTAPPVISANDITVEATSASGAAVVLAFAATDNVDPSPSVSADHASGNFPLGITIVVITATDAAGNVTTKNITVKVQDTTKPSITAPPDITVEATGPNGATVNPGVASATDSGGPVTVSGGGAAGQYALGTTTLTWIATDQSGNTAIAIQQITVRDTTAPLMTLPANITADATTPAGAVVTYSVTATDTVSSVSIACSNASGSTFTIGTTTVACSATDGAGLVATGTFEVLVLGAPAQVSNLIATVQSFNLDRGMTNSLSAKLQNILASLDAASPNGACGQLGAFLNEVRAQSGKKLTIAQAEQLSAAARRIQAVVGCQ